MARIGQKFIATFAFGSIAIACAASGCSSKTQGLDGADGGDVLPSSGSSGGGADSDGSMIITSSSGGQLLSSQEAGAPPASCSATGWECAVDTTCPSTSPTTLTGKVFDPAGTNPLYNVVVFVPNDPSQLPAIKSGTTGCNSCDSSIGDYVAVAQTGADGSFTLTGVPTGTDVPVTVQVGKWRRTVTVSTKSCATTAVSDGTLRLPRSQSEGSLPQMALLTGGCDDMACFLTNMGIADSEFTAPHGGGRVDVYQGVAGASLSSGTAGDCTNSSCPLWASVSSFEYYDMALFSCECGEQTDTNESTAAYTNLRDWLDVGGKVFASHFNYTWFKDNPSADFQGVATWLGSSIAIGSGAYDINNPSSFPKGQVYAQWLEDVGALASNGTPPTIDLQFVASSVSTVNTTTTQDWIYDPSTSPNDVKYLSFDTPIGGLPPAADAGESSTPNYCGKAVFTDLHTGGSLLSQYPSVPADCPKATLTSQQKALEFLFFDLSSCVTDDSLPPPKPPPPSMVQ